MNVRVLETDDGSGWVKVADQDGNSGLVPASYIQMAQGGSAETEKQLGSGKRGIFKPTITCFQHAHTTSSASNLSLHCSGSRRA